MALSRRLAGRGHHALGSVCPAGKGCRIAGRVAVLEACPDILAGVHPMSYQKGIRLGLLPGLVRQELLSLGVGLAEGVLSW